jgi:hypothetical protein
LTGKAGKKADIGRTGSLGLAIPSSATLRVPLERGYAWAGRLAINSDYTTSLKTGKEWYKMIFTYDNFFMLASS